MKVFLSLRPETMLPKLFNLHPQQRNKKAGTDMRRHTERLVSKHAAAAARRSKKNELYIGGATRAAFKSMRIFSQKATHSTPGTFIL
ncbi:unnamed protein product [Leptosia nina]|uniref:Uncharacterized protein n=1 Tax=Leptosia nina TaxID=320188 RepID=A0AAV1K1W3_9NEOP